MVIFIFRLISEVEKYKLLKLGLGLMNDTPLEFNSQGLSSRIETECQGVSSSASDLLSLEDRRRQERYYERNRNCRGAVPARQEHAIQKDKQFESNIETASVACNHIFSPFMSGLSDATSTSGVMDPSRWPMAPFTMMGDPGLLGMMGFGQFGFVRPSDGPMIGSLPNMMTAPVKEVVHLTNCILYPPKPNTPVATTRKRPPGCRTVFVGGLPENITEEIIREIFSRCGEISTIRTSKKNFCHIRYENEEVVDSAIYLSGYRVKIDDKDGPFTGRLHVDYAQARDDQYEWECSQRAFQRELRHRERMEQERLRPPSPPPVVHYSEHEASLLVEKLRGEESFQMAVLVLITWLDRGESNKKNAGQFYSMVQSTNSHVRRLMNEKAQYEEEMNKARLLLRQRVQGILVQCTYRNETVLAALSNDECVSTKINLFKARYV